MYHLVNKTASQLDHLLCRIRHIGLSATIHFGLALLLCFTSSLSFALENKTVLHIDSYTAEANWSAGITTGLESRLLVSDVNLQRHYMHAREQRTAQQVEQATAMAIARIEQVQPDLVIVSDDFAVHNVLVEHYQTSDLQFVYCGVNWSEKRYDLPNSNSAGIVETTHIVSIIDLLKSHSKGSRLGLLSINTPSEKYSYEHYKNRLGIAVEQAYFVNDMAEWESALLKLQDTVDFIYLENPEGIMGWDAKQAAQLVAESTHIPIGSSHAWLSPFSLFTITNVPQEQGWWAAEMAVKILEGKPPSELPRIRSNEGKLLANLAVATRLHIQLSTDVLQTAEIVGR